MLRRLTDLYDGGRPGRSGPWGSPLRILALSFFQADPCFPMIHQDGNKRHCKLLPSGTDPPQPLRFSFQAFPALLDQYPGTCVQKSSFPCCSSRIFATDTRKGCRVVRSSQERGSNFTSGAKDMSGPSLGHQAAPFPESGRAWPLHSEHPESAGHLRAVARLLW